MATVVIRRGDDSPIHVPHDGVAPGWSVHAELREYPRGPAKQMWDSADGSAVIEDGEVVLLCDRIGDNPGWTRGEVFVALTEPSGARRALDPFPVRLR